eukprot:4777531-Pyramimonas_sp.AAC.1
MVTACTAGLIGGLPIGACRYESVIFDAGEACNVRVTAHDDPPYSYVGPSPTHAWQQAIEAVNDVSQTRRRCAVRKPTL